MVPAKRRFGDRKDGWRLRKTQSFFAVMPHLMKHRYDAQVFFDEYLEIEELEKYVRRIRKEKELPSFSMYHLIIAAAVRMFVLRPRLNRFVINGKIFARNSISASMTAKKVISPNAPEVCIKPYFEKTDTLFDVYQKVGDAVDNEIKAMEAENGTDKVANILNRLPSWLVRLFVNFMTFLDHHNICTGFINQVSPFHTSFYITDVGSLGIGPVYHHIYGFGTTSAFIALGKKEFRPTALPDGTIVSKKVIHLRFVLDERICDGQYYTESIRMMRHLLKHPEKLEVPPTEFPEDSWI